MNTQPPRIGPDAPPSSARFDGLRPRAALCEHCGYHFNGVEVRANLLLSPECGQNSRIELPPIDPARPRLSEHRRRSSRLMTIITLLFLLGFTTMMVVPGLRCAMRTAIPIPTPAPAQSSAP